MGFAHPRRGITLSGTQETMLLRGREYEEGRVMALNTMFVKYIGTIYFDIFLFVKELYIKLLYNNIGSCIYFQEKYREMSLCEWD